MECQKTIQFYTQKNPSATFQSVILTGAFLTLQGIQDYLKNTLNMPIDTLKYNPKLTRENKQNEIRFEESLCLAIASSLQQWAPQPFNMLPPEYVTFQRLKKWAPRIVSLLLLWGLILAGIGMRNGLSIQALSQKVAQHTRNMQNIQKAEAAMLAHRPVSENPEHLQDIETRLASRAPIEPLLYHLSQKLPKDVQLSELIFTQNKFVIRGTRTARDPQAEALGQVRSMLPPSSAFDTIAAFALAPPAHIIQLTKDLKGLPYINDIHYDRKKKMAAPNDFELTGDYRL